MVILTPVKLKDIFGITQIMLSYYLGLKVMFLDFGHW